MEKDLSIPSEVSRVTGTLEKAGFEAYLIGGCVRDLLIKRTPKDWDVTTNAKPEEIIKLFSNTFYENDYGTVGVVNEDTEDETLKVVEVTPYRLESEYTDKRRPDSVSFSNNLEDDLKRRDFTVNAIALRIPHEKNGSVELIDLYKGQEDLIKGLLRTVGTPEDRFNEDALRTLRAIRISAELGFTIEKDTEEGIKKTAHLLQYISRERVRDEFSRILMSDRPMEGLITAEKLGLLPYIAPELAETIGVSQNKAHIYDVWEHLLRSLQHAADKKWPLHIRLSALFHDISKPETKRFDKEKNEYTFYGHEVVGERVVRKILTDLKFPKKTVDDVATLVRWHMFFSDTEQISLSAVRRLVANVGKDMIWDLMNVRICDRIGMGRPKESPYRLRKYKSMIEEAMHDPISVGMLKIDGEGVIKVTRETPGPRIGWLLHALLEEVLEDPAKNTKKWLNERVLELSKLSDQELKEIGNKGKAKKEAEEGKQLEEIRKKYWVS